MKIPVSQFIVRYMERLGIEIIFGIPGAHILPVYDALYASPIQTILAKHEQGASFMACGYNRASRKIAACIATAGPGATNLVTGIANAYADRQPVLIITGETSTYIFGRGGLQESSGEGGSIDQTRLFSGITRYNKVIERTDYLVQVLNQASRTLHSPTPGPVLLSIPFNVQQELIEETLLNQVACQPMARSDLVDLSACAQLAQLIEKARFPVIVAGHGCLRGEVQESIAELSHLRAIAVATSLKGKGVINEDDPLALGTLGVTSSGIAYKYITEKSDLVIFLGASFNERTSYLWDQNLTRERKVVQVDIDHQQLGRVMRTDQAIHGDIGAVLKETLEHLSNITVETVRGEHVASEIANLKGTHRSDYVLFHHGFSMIEKFFAALADHLPQQVALFDDNIIFAQNFFAVSAANRYYPNAGISSLGHAIPAAIGSRLSNQRTTFAVLGDGGFQMCCMEIMTAVNYGIPLNVVIFNNASMGLIRKNQKQHYDERYIGCDFINPDFKAMAKAFGVNHYLLHQPGEIDRLFQEADLHGTINLIEIAIDKDTFPNYSSKR